jgi:Transglutaminase-like superfamily
LSNILNKPYRLITSEVQFDHGERKKIQDTFFVVSDYLKAVPNPGACHFLSSIMYVLLNEQGIKSELCIGEVKTGEQYFDHSWIEINGKVFDVAIQITLDGRRNPPVFANYDLGTGSPTQLVYGSSTPMGLDRVARSVLETPFGKYLSNFDNKDGAWKIIKKLGRELRLKLDITDMKQKYKDTKRNYVVTND